MKPLILINFKTYKEGTGRLGLRLAKAVKNFKSKRYHLAVAPQLIDLQKICAETKMPVFSQHLDNIHFGSHTGSVLPIAVKASGAIGTILNHSEKQLTLKEIKESLELCKKLDLISIVCAADLKTIKKVLNYHPDFIAYEPKKLIGTNRSVTTENPKIITQAVDLCEKKNIKLIAGAGVHSKKDIRTAIKLGASGVLIAHKVVRAKAPRKILKELLE